MNYLLTGIEVYNLQMRRDAIIRELGLQDEQPDVFNQDFEIEEVIASCLTTPFFSENKVVLLENPGFIVSPKTSDEKAVNRLVEYLEDPLDTTTLIVYVDKPFDKRKKGYTTLRKYLRTESFDTVSEENFRNIVRYDLQNSKIRMSNEAFDVLIDRLPVDVLNWKSELEKLKLYPYTLDGKAIKALISRDIEDDVFQLSNAVVGRNMNQAVQIYRDLLVTNKNDAGSLIGLLAYQFRFMCQVKALNEMNYLNREIAERYDAKEYRITMTLKAAQGRSSRELLGILARLSRLDQNIKKGKADPVVGLEMFIIEVTRR